MPPRRVLIVSKFLHHVGGVETYVSWLSENLARVGIEVGFVGMAPPDGEDVMPELSGPVFLTPNRDYHAATRTRLTSAASSVYSRAAADVMRTALREFKPNLVHFQSTCYQLSSSVVAEAIRIKLPMVTTAHEYKFVCSNQRLWNDDEQAPCLRCIDRGTVSRMTSIVRSRCVKGSVGASVLAAAELPVWNGVWRRSRGVIHAPSRYLEKLLHTSGSPVGTVRYLDLSWGEAQATSGRSAARSDITYIGRLSGEKGVDTLIRAWPALFASHAGLQLRIYGSGSEEGRLRRLADGLPNVHFHGKYHRSDLARIFETALVSVHPSLWAENSPYTVRESLQAGVPAVVSDQGGLPEMVSAETGTVFDVGNARSLHNALARELDRQIAGTGSFAEAVAARVVSDESHLNGLLRMYDEARVLSGGVASED